MLAFFEISLPDETFCRMLEVARPKSGSSKKETQLTDDQKADLEGKLLRMTRAFIGAVSARNQPTNVEVIRGLQRTLNGLIMAEGPLRGTISAGPRGPIVAYQVRASLQRGMRRAPSTGADCHTNKVDLVSWLNDLPRWKDGLEIALATHREQEDRDRQREQQFKAGTAKPSEQARRSERTTGDPAAQSLVHDAWWAWWSVYGEMPGASVGHEGEVDGPFIRFVREILIWIGTQVSADLIEMDPMLKKCLTMSPAAIRQRLIAVKEPVLAKIERIQVRRLRTQEMSNSDK